MLPFSLKISNFTYHSFSPHIQILHLPLYLSWPHVPNLSVAFQFKWIALLLIISLVIVCVNMSVHIQASVMNKGVWVHQFCVHLIIWCFSSSFIIMRQGLLLNQKLTISAKLAGQWAPRMHLSLNFHTEAAAVNRHTTLFLFCGSNSSAHFCRANVLIHQVIISPASVLVSNIP